MIEEYNKSLKLAKIIASTTEKVYVQAKTRIKNNPNDPVILQLARILDNLCFLSEYYTEKTLFYWSMIHDVPEEVLKNRLV